MRQRKSKKVGVGKSMKEEKKSCPAGEYYCFDMGKCRPIPEGHKVREDGELVKEGASIIQGGTSRKKVSYRGPTAEKSKPKKSVSYRGEKDERIPVLNRKGKENKLSLIHI